MEKVIFLPGVITPAAIVYAPVLDELKGEIQPILKDLELYAADEPPADYGLHVEIEGILSVMAQEGLESAHFVAYSGGAAISLAFTAAYPQRVKSLAMFEPATIPAREWMQSEAGAAEWADVEAIVALPEHERMPLFMRSALQPGVEPPPPPDGPPAPWMAKRPAGVKALVSAFSAYDFPLENLHAFDRPVYLGYGLLSSAAEGHKADFLAKLFPLITVEAYPNLHHFIPPQRHEPQRFADALRNLWSST